MMWLSFFFLATLLSVNAFPWDQSVPLDLKEEIADTNNDDENEIRQIYDTDEFNKVDVEKKRFDVVRVSGENCGTNLPIMINSLDIPKVIVLGDNATVSIDANVSVAITHPTLITVEPYKVDLPYIPCIDIGFFIPIGTCNYTSPCDIMKQVTCPSEIVKLGWNCRCPFKRMRLKTPPINISTPDVPYPAFLIDGEYDVTVKMFDGSKELFCYKLSLTLKVKDE